MKDISKLVSNMSESERNKLISKLSNKKGEKKDDEIDMNQPFYYKFNSSMPFDIGIEQTEIEDPGKDLVQIKAVASSLNFRDVMIASGQYPESPDVPVNMGSDYAGIVQKVGENVDEFKKGDEVISLHVGHIENDKTVRDNCHFINVFNVHKNCISKKPDYLSFQEACCIPTVFLTAYISLVRLARIEKDEKVLIHTATGGVGSSALQIARWKDVEIFATAGTDKKRDYLREQGIEHIYDSRSTQFAEAIAENHELDVVLSTVDGERLMESMKLLGPFGRIVHIDKKDVATNTQIDMNLFINGISFHFLDISMLFKNPSLLKEALDEITSLFNQENFEPIPYEAYHVKDLKSALNTLSRGTHIGKIIVEYDT